MENLSRGMQQKIALARALLTSPMLMLLDEPTTGLDPRSKKDVQDMINEIRAEHNASILICTHDMGEAEALCDRIGIIVNGEIVAIDSRPAEGTISLQRRAAVAGRRLHGGHRQEHRRRRPGRGGRLMQAVSVPQDDPSG